MFISRFYITIAIGLIILTPIFAYSGNLDSPAAPTDASSAMYTLEDIYNRLNNGATVTKRSGAFTEPSAGPASSGKTLDDVMNLVNSRAPVVRTGQSASYSATSGEDGDLQKGVAWPSPRFTDNSNGTVTDNLTGLIWLKNANAGGTKTWENALSYCNNLASGSAGLTDDSVAGDWRLPNVKELQSLINHGAQNPALPTGHPFTNVVSSAYWSSTTYLLTTTNALCVNLGYGITGDIGKTNSYYVLPVRGGQ